MLGFRKRRVLDLDDREHAGCGKHPLDPATSICTSCARSCCDSCTLHVRGRALCIDCGIEMAGLRAKRRLRDR